MLIASFASQTIARSLRVGNSQDLTLFAQALIAILLSLQSPISRADDDSDLLWAIAFVEEKLELKRACELRFPQFKDQNESAFLASPYAKTTAEDVIAKLEDGASKTTLQQGLPTIRLAMAKQFQSAHVGLLEAMCEGFPKGLNSFKEGTRRWFTP